MFVFEAEKGSSDGSFRLALGNHCHRFGMCLVIIVVRGISGQSIRRTYRGLSCDTNLSEYRMPEHFWLPAGSALSWRIGGYR